MGTRLIVNADDFGLSDGVNKGIIEAHERGIVTSASLMVRHPGATHAAAYARSHQRLSLGLHLDLGEWRYRAGGWEVLYSVVSIDDIESVRAELDRQLSCFVAMIGRMPAHIDSHQHAHLREPARTIVTERAADLNIPLRHCGSTKYCGAFYGQTTQGEAEHDNITPDALIRLLAALAPGTTELACHPGYATGLNTMYAVEREVEVNTLCDSRVVTAIHSFRIELTSFSALQTMVPL